MNTISASDAAAAGFLTGSVFTVTLIAGVIWYILQIIAYWKIFEKAGEKGWKSIIPFYNVYVQYRATWKTSMFWVVIVLSVILGIASNIMNGYPEGSESIGLLISAIVVIVVGILLLVFIFVSYRRLSQAFGHGWGYTIGLIFLEPIFMLVLGFGSSRYIGNQTPRK